MTFAAVILPVTSPLESTEGKPGRITSTHLAQPDNEAAVDGGRGA